MSTLLTASFGASRTGLAGRVAYSLDGGSTWVTAGITEPVAGTGNYRVTVSATPPFFVDWRTGDGDTISPLLALISGGNGATDGSYTNGTFSGGGGSGGAFSYTVSGGVIQPTLTLTNKGSGYTSAPTPVFNAGGSGASASAATLTLPKPASEAVNATPAAVANVIHSGTAQGGTANAITLDAGASSIDDTYQMNLVYLSGGTGAGQTAVILYGGYVGSTREATISTVWATIPDGTTTFQVLPQGGVIVGAVGGAARTVTQDFNGTGSLTVLDADDRPIVGATVTAYLASAFDARGPDATSIAATTTDSLGRWSLSLAPSAYTLVFAYGGEDSAVAVIVN